MARHVLSALLALALALAAIGAPAPGMRRKQPPPHPAPLCGHWRMRWGQTQVIYHVELSRCGTYSAGSREGTLWHGTWHYAAGRVHVTERMAGSDGPPRRFSVPPHEPDCDVGGDYGGTTAGLQR